jgi:predicted NAD/FAD-dependent oxidoreductase
MTSTALVVGAGISGLACARSLADRGVVVRVVDRGRVAGGRLASRRRDGRPVDLGARYFTVPEGSAFAEVVAGWLEQGLVHPWTDTFQAVTLGQGEPEWQPKTGPMRYSAPGGLRSIAEHVAAGLRTDGVAVDLETPVDRVGGDGEALGSRYDAVVLAMPDPQAARMLAPDAPLRADLSGTEGWEPSIAVAAAWTTRRWREDLHGAFVDGSDVLAFVADDGDRRGDGAPVLVAHTTAAFARRHLEHPDVAVAPVVDALRDLFGIADAPVSTHAHRWSFASPARQHPEPFLVRGRIGVCGDAWGERSSVSTAWASGHALGQNLL